MGAILLRQRFFQRWASKRWRRVDPEQPGFRRARIAPAVRRGAFEIEAVARFELIVLFVANPDFKSAANDVKEFFAFVRVGLAAAAAGLDAKEMRLHGFIAPGKKFHANALCGFEDAAFGRRNEAGIFPGVVEKREKVRAVIARDARKRCDGGAHLAPFERAEKTDRDTGGTRDLHEREAAFLAEAAKSLAGRKNALRGNGDDALAFQNVHDGGGIQSAGAAKENGALQYAYVFHCVKAIFAARALRNDEAERLPCAQSGGRNADAASDFADPQKRLRVDSFRC